MSEKLKSRKLWAFIITVLIILSDYVFTLRIPSDALLYLVGIAASYILGQGYVDAKQQPVKELPVADITSAIANIFQEEISRTNVGKTLPLDELTMMFKKILATEMSKINAFTVSPSTPVAPPVSDPVPPAGTPDIVIPAV